jgi:hypothetical protein
MDNPDIVNIGNEIQNKDKPNKEHNTKLQMMSNTDSTKHSVVNLGVGQRVLPYT